MTDYMLGTLVTSAIFSIVLMWRWRERKRQDNKIVAIIHDVQNRIRQVHETMNNWHTELLAICKNMEKKK